MSLTAIREERQTTLPADVSEAAGLQPGDQVDWRFENGEIRGRKLVAQPGLRRVKAQLIESGGTLRFETPGVQLDSDAIAQAVADERASR